MNQALKPNDYSTIHIGTPENGTLCFREYASGNCFTVQQFGAYPDAILRQSMMCPTCIRQFGRRSGIAGKRD